MDFIGIMAPEHAKARFEMRLEEAEAEARVRQVQGSAATSQAKQPGIWSRIMNLLSLAAR